MASEMTPYEVCLSVLENRDATDSEIREAGRKAGFKRKIQDRVILKARAHLGLQTHSASPDADDPMAAVEAALIQLQDALKALRKGKSTVNLEAVSQKALMAEVARRMVAG